MTGSTQYQRVHLADALVEVTRGIGEGWAQFSVLGATRDGVSLAKEPVGKAPERYKLVEPGTIFYNPMRILIGSIALLDEGRSPGITSPDYVVFRTRPGVLHPRWFYYWLRSLAGSHFIRTLARGAVRERMLFRRLTTGDIIAPAFEVQQRFAEMVLTVERIQAAAEARLQTVSDLVEAHTNAIFRGPQHRRWPRRRLADCAAIVGGIQKTPHRAPNRNPVQYLTVRNVQRGRLDLTHVEKFEVSADELERLRLAQADILIVEGNGSAAEIGRNALFSARDEDWIHQNHVIRVRLRPDMAVPEFVSGFLNSATGRAQMLEKARTTSGLYSLSVRKVGELEVPLPSIPEQRALAEALRVRASIAASAREAAEGEVAAIRALPASLLRRAFSEGL